MESVRDRGGERGGVVIGSSAFRYTSMSSHSPGLEMNANPISIRQARVPGALRLGLGRRGGNGEGEDSFVTLGMQGWRIGMRVRNVRTPGGGGAGGRQNSVRESLLRGQSAAGPNARGARGPSAAEESGVFTRRIALVDWAV